MTAKKLTCNLKNPMVCKRGVKLPGAPYIRPGSRITAIRQNQFVAYVTIVPAKKKNRGFGKPFTLKLAV